VNAFVCKAYRDTGLTPEEINKIVSGAPVKVSFDIGDEGFLTAINGAFKERFGITADKCSETISDLQSERDTLKKALELACEDCEETDHEFYCNILKHKSVCPYGNNECAKCVENYYIQRSQEGNHA